MRSLRVRMPGDDPAAGRRVVCSAELEPESETVPKGEFYIVFAIGTLNGNLVLCRTIKLPEDR